MDKLSPVIAALNNVDGSSLHAALKVGEVIVRFLYEGDMQLLRARGPVKASSFRQLSTHPSVRWSSSSLWRAVAIYELSLRFPEIVNYAHTSVAHLSVVLGLPPQAQYALLRQTEREHWSRRKLEQVVRDWRSAGRLPYKEPTQRATRAVRVGRFATRTAPVGGERELRGLIAEVGLARSRAVLTEIESALNSSEARAG